MFILQKAISWQKLQCISGLIAIITHGSWNIFSVSTNFEFYSHTSILVTCLFRMGTYVWMALCAIPGEYHSCFCLCCQHFMFPVLFVNQRWWAMTFKRTHKVRHSNPTKARTRAYLYETTTTTKIGPAPIVAIVASFLSPPLPVSFRLATWHHSWWLDPRTYKRAEKPPGRRFHGFSAAWWQNRETCRRTKSRCPCSWTRVR